MHRPIRTLYRCAVLLALVLAGCARLPVTGNLPPGVSVTRLATLDTDSPIAWKADGAHIAFVSGGIRTISAASGEIALVAPATATALSWSPDDSRLAAALPDGAASIIRLFDRTGAVAGETRVAGTVGRIIWKDTGEMLITATELRMFSFGGNVVLHLFSWDGTGTPQETTLANTTLKRSTVADLKRAYRCGADMDLSPMRDEIAFTRLVDPPMFPPYLKVVLHHLVSGGEREVAIIPFPSAMPVYAADSEHLLAYDGSATGRLIAPPEENSLPEFPAASTIAQSPGGASRFLHGQLSIGSGPTVEVPHDARGIFSPTGDRLAIAWGDELYLVSGLPADGRPSPQDADRSRLLFLRRLRSEGLITNRDYLDQKERILHP